MLETVKLELEGVTELELELELALLGEGTNWLLVLLVVGSASEDVDDIELLANDKELADALWVDEFELDSPLLDGEESGVLPDTEVAFEDKVGTGFAAVDESLAVELGWVVPLDDEFELLNGGEDDEAEADIV